MSRSRKKPFSRSGRYGVAEKKQRNVKTRCTPLESDPLVRYRRGGDQEGDWGGPCQDRSLRDGTVSR